MGPSPWLPDILKPWLLSVVVFSAEWAGENLVMPQGIAWVPTVVLLPLFCSYFFLRVSYPASSDFFPRLPASG